MYTRNVKLFRRSPSRGRRSSPSWNYQASSGTRSTATVSRIPPASTCSLPRKSSVVPYAGHQNVPIEAIRHFHDPVMMRVKMKMGTKWSPRPLATSSALLFLPSSQFARRSTKNPAAFYMTMYSIRKIRWHCIRSLSIWVLVLQLT